jgi:hypothetical protein
MANSIMIQNIDDRTAEWIEKEARSFGVTAEAIVIRLIHKGIESDRKTAGFHQIYSDLDDLAGTWNEEETAEFLDAVKDFSRIEYNLWK